MGGRVNLYFVNTRPNLIMEYLLPIHILAGTIALFAAAFAICSEKGKKIHITAGRTYYLGMAGIFLTALPMSIITSNIFLFLIAFFSFYLAFAGRRFAQNRKGCLLYTSPSPRDKRQSRMPSSA